MPEFDPTANGRRSEEDLPALPPRGRGVMLLVSVSGLTLANLILGSIVGAVIGAALGTEGDARFRVVLTCAGIGAVAGVWLGVRFGERMGGTSGEAGRLRLFLSAVSGLAIGVALVPTVDNAFVPITAIMLPGIAAVIADVLATRGLHRAHAEQARRAREESEGSVQQE